MTVPVLSREDQFLHLLYHGGVHGFFRLRWLLDLAILLGREEYADWSALIRRAGEMGLGVIFAQALQLSGLFFGFDSASFMEKYNGEVSLTVASSLRVHLLCRFALEQITSVPDMSTPTETISIIRRVIRLAKSLRCNRLVLPTLGSRLKFYHYAIGLMTERAFFRIGERISRLFPPETSREKRFVPNRWRNPPHRPNSIKSP
ncbi:MAG TPA: nucleotidyltransferase family protein [Rectinemataceae bacterium]|nr:nucleotidyltransferase family protein [Rectinemataceae bacterium]